MSDYKPWDVVALEGRTDLYRVYTYRGRIIFAGLHSDTVTDESRDTVCKNYGSAAEAAGGDDA